MIKTLKDQTALQYFFKFREPIKNPQKQNMTTHKI